MGKSFVLRKEHLSVYFVKFTALPPLPSIHFRYMPYCEQLTIRMAGSHVNYMQGLNSAWKCTHRALLTAQQFGQKRALLLTWQFKIMLKQDFASWVLVQ